MDVDRRIQLPAVAGLLASAFSVASTATVAALPLPRVGSADVLIYAAYGRMAATGADPYRTEPYDYARAGDPVAKAVLPPWRRSASAYGPIARSGAAAAAAAH